LPQTNPVRPYFPPQNIFRRFIRLFYLGRYLSDLSCDVERVKTKSMLEKPWWPEPRYELPLAAALDPLVLFRHLVMCFARRTGLSLRAQAYALVATGVLHASDLRPDLGRQAQEWVNQHRHPPRPIRPRRVRPARSHASLPVASVRLTGPRPNPARLEREALVTRLRDQEHLSFKAIAVRLGTTREQARQIHARALRRHRQRHFLLA
jgi:hypothetical protein